MITNTNQLNNPQRNYQALKYNKQTQKVPSREYRPSRLGNDIANLVLKWYFVPKRAA
jgi:hypothetical protein